MDITLDTTVLNVLEQFPEALEVFASHGVDVTLECPECILETSLSVCESMCHIDDLDELIKDLQVFVGSGQA
ncbi:MAG: hypothetical protein IT342_16800 [Candidatus Melainabacteria bacterium]|nr:hypothetical protein [Candidatus Melainabacteria bacterium]